MPAHPDYAFENFPRARLVINPSRRAFLSDLLHEFHVYSKRDTGHIGRKLSDLGAWEDQDLAALVPQVVAGKQIRIEGDMVAWMVHPGRTMALFPLASPAVIVLNCCNGENTLTEIAGTLASQVGWGGPKSFAYVRGVFLSLVLIRLVEPRW